MTAPTAAVVTADKQFSIPAPWPEPPGKKTPVFFDCFGDNDYVISIADEDVCFSWSDRFGPLPQTKRGRPRELRPSHRFWRAVSLWNLQGKRTENGFAIWHEPKKPVLKHLGGRNYLVIEDGEPGHDW